MKYTLNEYDGKVESIQLGAMSIPLALGNSDYQAVLNAIIVKGADCFDGDIRADVQAAANAKAAAD